jgi:excisionase family DNA binding protein
MLLTTTDVANRLNCSAENVRLLEKAGKLKAEKTVNGKRIFRSEDVDAYAAEREAKKQAKAA